MAESMTDGEQVIRELMAQAQAEAEQRQEVHILPPDTAGPADGRGPV